VSEPTQAIANALYTALTTALGANVTGVFPGVAPEGTAAPYVTYQKADGFDRRVFRARATVWTEWLVKAWDEGDSVARAQAIAALVDGALDEQTLTVSGWTTICCRRVRALPDMAEEASGLIVRSAGARYEVEVR
jgi:hypothetical protein